MQHSTIGNQLASKYGCVHVTGLMDTQGVTFDLSIPEANLKVAELEENLDIMEDEVAALSHGLYQLLGAGERERDRFNWAIMLDGKVFRDGYDTKQQAHEVVGELIDEMEQSHGEDRALQASLRLGVERIGVFPQSRWVVKLKRDIVRRINQIDQTRTLIENIKAA